MTDKNEIIRGGQEMDIPRSGSWPEAVHKFDNDSAWAIRAALAAQRPLLVRGEPGCGKSQLARAAARALGRAFIAEVVHARSESQDLQWHFDAVARLGAAQALGAAKASGEDLLSGMTVKENGGTTDPLDAGLYLSPGALWWAFNWDSAEKQFNTCAMGRRRPERPEGWKPADGCVLLIDEIDKADADLPNGLLETLGNGAFTVPYLAQQVVLPGDMPPPLVVITTNEERELPGAFLRRCMVLQMALPETGDELKTFLMERGRLHFKTGCWDSVYEEAAEQLCRDRERAENLGLQPPGQAEYLDLLRAVREMGHNETDQLDALAAIASFALNKHPREQG
jgi:MoxR-like ATPase